jgi:hypothetical protein
MDWRAALIVPAVLLVPFVGNGVSSQRVAADTRPAMNRVAAYVENYYSRAQSVLATETVSVQNVGRDMTGDGFTRRFVYNIRVEWSPSASGPPDATFSRELVTVNGRAPREGDEPHCTAPKPITPEPLAMFLRERQPEFTFTAGELTRLDGRSAVRVDYRIRQPEADAIEWDRDCVLINVPSRIRGRAWIDDASGEVLRIDETATGPVEIAAPRAEQRRGQPPLLVFDRMSESIRYRPVTFHDPEETIMLPASVEILTMVRSGGTRRSLVYSNYRRFVTEGRVLP